MKTLVIPDPRTTDKKEVFAFLLKNKQALLQQKRLTVKYGEAFSFIEDVCAILKGGQAVKMDQLGHMDSPDVIKVLAAINSTNIMDSHYDVHLPGLWDKSVSENRMILHLQEHEMEFEKIIADGADLKVMTKLYNWKELGFDFKGKTEVLLFESLVRKSRNAYMFEQYKRGYVKYHSVGMIYIKNVLCINEPDDKAYGAEFEAWEKYFPEIANKEFAEEIGFFWAVKEAKVIEGSAVPRGSNYATPTLGVSEPKKNHSDNEPPKGTQDGIDYNFLAQNFKIN